MLRWEHTPTPMSFNQDVDNIPNGFLSVIGYFIWSPSPCMPAVKHLVL